MRWLLIRAAFLAVLVGGILLVELMARMFVVHGLGIDQDSYESYYLSNPDYGLVMWAETYEPHPYFGYVRPDKLRELERFREERDPGEYVIAILGGSVAEGFGEYVKGNPEFIENLRRVIPTVEDRPIRIVNFALGGYKQPQQFFLASYILEHVDLTMNIDGLNEMTKRSLYPSYPMDFPALTLKFFPREGHVNVYSYLSRMLIFSYKVLHRLPIRFSILARSSLYFLIWKGMYPQIYRGIRELDRRYLISVSANETFGQEQTLAEAWQRKVEIWQKYTRLQYRVAQTEGVAAYFFLQPNQYVKDSKTFSAEERAIAINPEIAEDRHAQMSLLREAAQHMRAERLSVFDLTQIYRQTTEPVYRDACCHLVELGNEIMGEQIIATIERGTIAKARRDVE